jgi:hypothetical protein
LPGVEGLGRTAQDEGIRAVYLLGMGGSSLCAEVLRSVFGTAEGHPDLFVLDTTDELTITSAAARLEPRETLFLVSSKSGGTVEVASMERFFWSHMSARLGAGAGRHFVAITDPGTALQRLADSRGYRDVFLNPADIGGRFSALSLFGLVPAALIGSTSSFTPFDSMTASVVASPLPSSIIRPYWNPEQPPPWTNTRRPASTLFSSVSSSVIFEAAEGVT